MKSDELLKSLIIERFGSIAKFSRACGIPETTLFGIFRRGVLKSNVSSIIKVCKTLRISTDELIKGRIVPIRPENDPDVYDVGCLPEFLRSLEVCFLHGEPIAKSKINFIADGLEIILEMAVKK